jgi:hypothetical protein
MKTKSLAIFHLVFWIFPVLLCIMWLCLSPKMESISMSQWIYAGLISAFGPYATFFAHLGDLPNAGEFFSVIWALGLTVPLMAVVILSYVLKNRWFRILCYVLYVPLILFWVAFGFLQIGSCLT